VTKQLSRAVQERRAPKEIEQETPERRRWRDLDYFCTPPFASRAGAELVKRLDPGAESVWEPAAGSGIMAECLKETFPQVYASDIWPQGYGAKVNFLDATFEPPQCEWVITNPPFNAAISFLKRGLEIASSGVALLCRGAFLESAERYEPLFRGEHPLTVFAPFSERVPMQLCPWDPKCSTATFYGWFLFVKESSREMKWAARIHPIPPGTRARLSKPDDIRRFCREKSAPLFEGGNLEQVDAGA
jgi:hypothetical protein